MNIINRKEGKHEPRPVMNMNLPATPAEAARLTRAQDFARQLDPLFGAEENRAFARRCLSVFLLTAEGRMSLTNMARMGEEESQTLLRDTIFELESRDEKLPTELKNYNMQILNGEIPTTPSWGGRRKKNTILRDICICMMVVVDCARFGTKPTGHSARRRSACAIVAEALCAVGISLGYDDARKIWKRYRNSMPSADSAVWRF